MSEEMPALKKERRPKTCLIQDFRDLWNKAYKHIVSRKNISQTNGKLESFWLEYDRHR